MSLFGYDRQVGPDYSHRAQRPRRVLPTGVCRPSCVGLLRRI